MSLLVLQAYSMLLYFDFHLARGNFSALYQTVRRYPAGSASTRPDITGRICSSVDTACMWYWKEVRCLQRSAVTACLLKRHGVPAQLLIGVQQMPFKAHAWVEVEAQVINDKPYMREVYAVLDQC